MNTGAAQPGRRRSTEVQRGWYFYDWANSAFATTVVAVFLGPYLTSIAETAACGHSIDATHPCAHATVHVLGLPVATGSYYSYVLSLAILLQVVVLPITGAIADRYGHKRFLLGLFAYLGSLATMALYFVTGRAFLLGGVLYLIATVSFSASVVVYNAFLPDISAPADRDDVSARGWALGYLGGGLLLLLNLVLFLKHGALGMSESMAVRVSLTSAGAWWAVFTLIPLRRLRLVAGRADAASPGGRVLTSGFRQLGGTLREARGYPQTLLFLVAYLFYNDGIQSVIGLSAVYADKELGLGQTSLVAAILMVQFVAFFGALLLGRLAARYGAQRTVLGSLVVWTGVIAVAFFLQAGKPAQFFLLGALIGIVMGGSQALSRSLFSQIIPRGREAEYFGLYEVSERGTSWLGAFTFGIVYQLTGSYRDAIISLVVFFVIGFLLLRRVDLVTAVARARPPQADPGTATTTQPALS